MAYHRRYLASYRRKSELAEAIRHLPEPLGIFMSLLYCEELNIAEIAVAMRTTERKTRRMLKLAHELLGYSGATEKA